MFKLVHISLVHNPNFTFLNASESWHCVLQMLCKHEWGKTKQKDPIIANKIQNVLYFLNESFSRSHLPMHFCAPLFGLSKAPRIYAIPTSRNSEKHVALHFPAFKFERPRSNFDFRINIRSFLQPLIFLELLFYKKLCTISFVKCSSGSYVSSSAS